jgi:hypothetical protein
MMHGIKWGRLSVIGLIIALVCFLLVKPFIGGTSGFISALALGGLSVFAILFWSYIAWGRNHR